MRAISIALLVFLMSPIAQAIAQEAVEATVQIARTSMSFSFPKQSLSECEVFDLADGKEKDCALYPAEDKDGARLLKVQLYQSDDARKTVGVEGVIEIKKPIRIRFSSTGEHNKPFMRVPANALAGARIKVAKFTVTGPFGALIRASPRTFTIHEHSLLVDSVTGSSGNLTFRGNGWKLDDLKLVLPGTAPSRSISIAASGETTVRFDLGTKRGHIVKGRFEGKPALSFAAPQTLSVHGLVLGIGSQLQSSTLGITVANSNASVQLSGLRLSGISGTYTRGPSVRGTFTNVIVGSIASETRQFGAQLRIEQETAAVDNVEFAGQFSFSADLNAPESVTGNGIIKMERLTSDTLKGKISLNNVSRSPQFGSRLIVQPKSLAGDFTRTGSAAALVFEGIFNVEGLTIGNFALKSPALPLIVKTNADGSLAISLTNAPTSLRIDAGSNNATPVIEGKGIIEQLRAQISHLGTTTSEIRFQPKDLRVSLDKPNLAIALAGGQLSLPENRLIFESELLYASAARGLEGTLRSVPAQMTAPALNTVLVPSGVSIRIGGATLAAGDAYFTVDPREAAASPFGLSGTFSVTNLSAKFEKPTALRANDLELRATEVSIGKVSLTVNLVKARVSVEVISIVGDYFKMEGKSGKTDVPTLTGTLSQPAMIKLAEADIPYALPIEMFNLQIRDAALKMSEVKYVDPLRSTLSLPEATLAIKELTDSRISAYFEEGAGYYEAKVSSSEFTGNIRSALTRVRLNLEGPREPLTGSLEIALGRTVTGGTIGWNPLRDCCGDAGNPNLENPNYSVPLAFSLTVPEISGRFDFVGDIATGGLSTAEVSSILAHYLGPRSEATWTHSWLLQSETRWRTEYPCFGTWTDPVRTCEASGILLPRIDAKLTWHFVLLSIHVRGGLKDYWLKPKNEEKEFACTPDPVLCPGGTIKREVTVGIKQCKGHLTAFEPLVASPAFSLYPDLAPGGGDLAKLFNNVFGGIAGYGESVILASVALASNLVAQDFYVFKDC